MFRKSNEEQLAALIAEVKRNDFSEDLVTADGSSLMMGKISKEQRR